MPYQLLEGLSNPSTYYTKPEPGSYEPTWLIKNISANQASFYDTYKGTTIELIVRGNFDPSTLPVSAKTLLDLPKNNTNINTGYDILVGQKNQFTVNFNPGINQATMTRYTEATSNADYEASLSGDDVYTAASGLTSGATFLWGGNDTYIHRHLLQQYTDQVYGGDGTDTVVFDKVSSGFTIKAGNVWNELTKKTDLTGFTVTDKNKVLNTLQVNQVERLQFTDTSIAYDIGSNQTAGSGYMLYKAAFNRTPDVGGLGYWISKMDGGMSYNDVAKNFVTSAEFKTAFGGSNPSVNTLVTKLYNNVLNRTPDAGGLTFWQDKLNTGWSTADVLGFFSTSGENVTNVTPLIANGISYTQFVG
jgi:hypothetical protein